MRNKFKVGDKVTPVDPNRRTYGHVGTVTESHSWGDVVVKFDHLSAPATFHSANLRMADSQTRKKNDAAIHVVVFDFTDCILDKYAGIIADINSTEAKEAIIGHLTNPAAELGAIVGTEDEIKEHLGTIASDWKYVFGLYDGKPFRMQIKTMVELVQANSE